jgi:hypothetical protein
MLYFELSCFSSFVSFFILSRRCFFVWLRVYSACGVSFADAGRTDDSTDFGFTGGREDQPNKLLVSADTMNSLAVPETNKTILLANTTGE